MNRKSLVVGLTVVAVVAVLGLAIFLITQPPAAKEDTTGAIGAAQRYHSEQIKEGDTGIDVESTGPVAPMTVAELADMLGRVGADLRVDALNHATLEQQAALWANASPLEKVNAYLRLDPGLQKQVAERMNPTERQAFERLSAERAAQEKLSSDLGRIAADLRVDALNHASLEQQAAMFEAASPLAKMDAYLRLDPGLQKQVAERMSPTERQAFERVATERASTERASSERASSERASTERASSERASSERVSTERISVERAAAERAAVERIDALNKASLENQAALFGKLDPLAKADAYLRVDPGLQKQVTERMNPTERQAFEKASAERASAERAASERASSERASTERASSERASTERISAERAAAERAAVERADALNKASLENQSALFGKLDPLAKADAYLRLDPGLQKQVAERMNPTERQAFERVSAERVAQEKLSSDLGRIAADLRVDALNHASLEQQAAMFEAASPLAKMDAYLRLDPTAQKAVTERMNPTERAAFERAAAERAATERASSERASTERASTERASSERASTERISAERMAAERVAIERIDALNKASLESQAALFGKLDPLAKADAYLRLDPGLQKQVVERMNPGERAAFERAAAERVSVERAASERAAAERAAAERVSSERAGRDQ